jgi:hypothetical protein
MKVHENTTNTKTDLLYYSISTRQCVLIVHDYVIRGFVSISLCCLYSNVTKLYKKLLQHTVATQYNTY